MAYNLPLRSILILSTHLRFGLPRCLFVLYIILLFTREVEIYHKDVQYFEMLTSPDCKLTFQVLTEGYTFLHASVTVNVVLLILKAYMRQFKWNACNEHVLRECMLHVCVRLPMFLVCFRVCMSLCVSACLLVLCLSLDMCVSVCVCLFLGACVAGFLTTLQIVRGEQFL